jgi:hypothetical protein
LHAASLLFWGDFNWCLHTTPLLLTRCFILGLAFMFVYFASTSLTWHVVVFRHEYNKLWFEGVPKGSCVGTLVLSVVRGSGTFKCQD